MLLARKASRSNSRVVERDDLAGPARLAPAQVDLEVADVTTSWGAGPSLVRRRMARDPGHQLAGRERLDQVVVGPQLQPEDAVHLVVARREEEDGHRAAGPDLAADLEAVACAGRPTSRMTIQGSSC